VSTALVTLIASATPAYANKDGADLMHLKPQEFQHTAKMGVRAHSIHNHNEQGNNKHSDKQLNQGLIKHHSHRLQCTACCTYVDECTVHARKLCRPRTVQQNIN